MRIIFKGGEVLDLNNIEKIIIESEKELDILGASIWERFSNEFEKKGENKNE